MTWTWSKEDRPTWDADKQRIFRPAELAAVGLTAPDTGDPLADEWWRASDEDGTVVGYGWLDNEWGDAQITFVVDRDRRGEGIGAFVVAALEAEAAAQGVNYIYNVVPDSHPDPEWMTGWLTGHGFTPGTGDLRRRVRTTPDG